LKHFFYFFFLFSGSLFAQEAHILFNRLNMSVFNPAFTGTNGAFISLNSRSQWTGVSEAPRTNYLIYKLPKKERVRLGFSAQNDWRGVYEQTGELLSAGSYYYRIDLGDGIPIKDGWIYLSY
jgi:hypothetical protein